MNIEKTNTPTTKLQSPAKIPSNVFLGTDAMKVLEHNLPRWVNLLQVKVLWGIWLTCILIDAIVYLQICSFCPMKQQSHKSSNKSISESGLSCTSGAWVLLFSLLLGRSTVMIVTQWLQWLVFLLPEENDSRLVVWPLTSIHSPSGCRCEFWESRKAKA